MDRRLALYWSITVHRFVLAKTRIEFQRRFVARTILFIFFPFLAFVDSMSEAGVPWLRTWRSFGEDYVATILSSHSPS
jgi:hypothetical protein